MRTQDPQGVDTHRVPTVRLLHDRDSSDGITKHRWMGRQVSKVSHGTTPRPKGKKENADLFFYDCPQEKDSEALV